MKKALQDLENAKTEEEIDKCRQVVQEVRETSEKSVMVLQVGRFSPISNKTVDHMTLLLFHG